MKKKSPLLLLIPLLIVACSNQNSSSAFSSSELINSSSDNTSSDTSTIPSSFNNSSSEQIISSSTIDVSSSSKKESSSLPPVKEGEYRINFNSILLVDEDNQSIPLTYDIPKDYLSFDHLSETFNKNLALAAFAFVACAPFKDKATEAYTSFGFDNLVFSNEYEEEENKDTVLYVIGHKKLDNYDLVNISLSGYNYAKPWESNLTIGKSGNHTGFQNGAMKILPTIINYLKTYEDVENLKLFINGYSRSAAIASVVSIMLMDANIVSKDNLYAYLFETPRSVDIKNSKEYKSIFNIINSGDLVTHVPPEEYGLKRVGQDIELYNENTASLLSSFNDNLSLVSFTPIDENNVKCDNDIDFSNYLINYLLEPIESADGSEVKDISSRENYCNNEQQYITYLAGFFLGLSSSFIQTLIEEVSKLDNVGLLNLIATDGLYNYLSPILDKNNISYDQDMLKESTNALVVLIQHKRELIKIFSSETFRNNAMRTIYLHTLETVLPLLINL